MKTKKPPVIIIGMHRSGTTLLSKLLENAGIFMGNKKEINNEALFFLKFNEYIFKQASASWDSPINLKFTNNFFKENIKRIFKKRANSPLIIKYLGIKKFLKYRTLERLPTQWGWKDPRNTFTLEIWRELYPDAKVIHIYRNPVDVANSLKVRSLLNQEKKKSRPIKTVIGDYFLKSSVINDSFKVQNLNQGYELWKEYVEKSYTYSNVLHIKFEDLVNNSKQHLSEIFKFIDYEVSENILNTIITEINHDKKLSFLSNPELKSFYKTIQNDPLLKTLKFDKLNGESL